jgi:D-tyrosyl-tRNA(Tyr) deacylase
MIGLIQRVCEAQVTIAHQPIATIDRGLLVFVAVVPDDTPSKAARLLERLLSYRVFADADERMNLSVRDISGGLLLVPQFTLAADTRKGCRPSFVHHAASPEQGAALFLHLVQLAHARYEHVASGQFGANMQVRLINDGPATFWLES